MKSKPTNSKNGYIYTKWILDWTVENQLDACPTIIALAVYFIELNNKSGWCKNFNIYGEYCMKGCGIKSYNTYKKTLDKLVEIGFIKLVRKSYNQYQCNVISLINLK